MPMDRYIPFKIPSHKGGVVLRLQRFVYAICLYAHTTYYAYLITVVDIMIMIPCQKRNQSRVQPSIVTMDMEEVYG